jgi:excisionase family DNA binding protein
MTYKSWLKRQLRKLDNLDEYEGVYDDLRELLYESARRAADAGNPKAVLACKIRHGGITPDIVQEVFAECLSHCESDTLTVQEAAAKLNISQRKVYDLCSNDQLKHTSKPIRIQLKDLEVFRRRQ